MARPETGEDRGESGSMTDELTGLGNLARLEDKVRRLIETRRSDPAPFAIAIAGLDSFRPINDLFGRAAGDEILLQAATRLHAAMDSHSIVTRSGGDEFAVLLPMVFREDQLREHCRVLADILSAPYDTRQHTVRLSASVGAAIYDFDGEEDAAAFYMRAESALHHAKRNTTRIVIHSRALKEAAHRAVAMEQALRRAVIAGEVEPHFQPIVDLRSRRVDGFECLARWTDAELGSVPPSMFIAVAEECGIIGELSQLLLRQATAVAREWPAHMFLSFNLSPMQLVDPDAAQQILATLAATGFDPRRLEIEVTETGMMTDPETAGRTIAELCAAGIRVSLDDFGTGQSSLGRLRQFRFDKIKIDRAFVSAILDDRPSEHIVRAILSMCQGLGVETVAEGIEAEAQADRLVEYGCQGGQGFYFGRPRNALATRGLLRDADGGGIRPV